MFALLSQAELADDRAVTLDVVLLQVVQQTKEENNDQTEENDDILMCLIANGGYTGIPDCHLVFINALYGKILVLCYEIIPYIEWYTLSFCLLHIVSMTVIIYCIINFYFYNRTKTINNFIY